MTITSPHPETDTETPGWSAAAHFLDAFSRRDFAAMAQSLDSEVCLRALIPPGPLGVVGAAGVADCFRRWFGGDDHFEVLDAAIGALGTRMYLRWRVRMRAADGAAHIAEQHVFATATERIAALDLLCSGFQAEGSQP